MNASAPLAPRWKVAASVAALAAAATAVAAGSAAAQTVEVPSHQAVEGVELGLTLREVGTGRSLRGATTRSAEPPGPLVLRRGTRVEICLEATRAGYLTLWTVDEADRPARLYPNRWSHADGEQLAGAPVADRERICIGGDDSVALTVGGRSGETYQLSLNWTPSADLALPADAYVQIGPRSAGAPVTGRTAGMATTHLSYSVAD